MGLEEQLSVHIAAALDELVAAGDLSAEGARGSYSVEPPRKGGSGHVATNVALALGKRAGLPPPKLAGLVADRLRTKPRVKAVEVAGPGFLNVTLEPDAFWAVLRDVSEQGRAFGRGAAATGERVLVEFVSANPTGPLLISHGRGAVVGDAIASLLEAAGHRVTREYYINDFGNQVRLLAESVRAAHRGEPPPEGGYGGGYVKDLAAWVAKSAPLLLDPKSDAAELARECVTRMLEGVPGTELGGIRATLAALGVFFDVWTSEESFHRWGKVRRTLDLLESKGRLAEQDGALVFTTGSEDDKDRVLRKRDGAYTYFASDIAYHEDKLARGFDRLVNLWGADHHGYVARVRSALEALGMDAGRFEVVLFQLVNLLRDGKPYKMGKRLGNLITIDEVSEEIDRALASPAAGRDALRYFYLSRRVDTPIDLDIELAKRQKSENPVFYVQYGHARLCAIQRRAADSFGLRTPRYTDALARRLDHPLELDILAQLGRYGAVLREAARAREPVKVVEYLRDLATSFQSYYTRLRSDGDSILPLERERTPGWEDRWDKDKTLARLVWVEAIRTVYGSGLALLGVSAPERMSALDSPTEDPEEASPAAS